jgi:hypothetical protein
MEHVEPPLRPPPHVMPSRKPFTIEEDARLIELANSTDRSAGWNQVANQMPGRSARQCRERWATYLAPSIRVAPWTVAEDNLLLSQISVIGNQWAFIARLFNGRSVNDVKNRWYSHLRDVVRENSNGILQVQRNFDGSIIPVKKKRHRKLTSPSRVALAHLSSIHPPILPEPFPVSRLPGPEQLLAPLQPRPRHQPS